ncbi:MAG: hypothetical protein LBT51_11155 [Fusobacteriaceae bacterium]|jgi:hypothetical protein|nr:hypothetical protein [Fusobacteriaceae bacterium]
MIKKFDKLKNIYKENIKNIFVIVSMLALIFVFMYKFIISPINNIKDIKNQIKNTEKKILNQSNELEKVNMIYNKRLEENIRDTKIYEDLLKKYKEISFENIGIFTQYIEKIATFNKIEIVSIGGLENYQDKNELNFNRFGCPYELKGTTENINRFLYSLEHSLYFLSILDAPITIEINNNIVKLIFKISVNIINDANDSDEKISIGNDEDENYFEKKNIKTTTTQMFLLNYKIENIKTYDVIGINNKKYVVIKFINNRKKIYLENEIITIDNLKYKIKIKADNVYLEI